MSNNKSMSEIIKEKSDKKLAGVAYWGSYYRKNPHRLAADYLNIKLKVSQKILIYCMMICTNFLYVASRGSGKTWLVALYCVIRCILYPNTKICIVSGFKSQSIEVISKIELDFMKNYGWGSEILKKEIQRISTGINDPVCEFRDGSYIKVVTARDSSRHNRANIVIADEYRMVPLNIMNTVIKKFLTAPRHPGYLDNPKYSHLVERNCEMYMSSAWFKSHWSFDKFKSYFANMLDDKKKYFAVDLPYQLAIKEGLLMRDQIEDEMSEADFDQLSFYMEMMSLWFEDSDGSLFKYEDLNARRVLKNIYLPLDIYATHRIKIPDLQPREVRVLSVDVALMASRKHDNDLACTIIASAIPNNSGEYISDYPYIETFEGLTTDELGITIMRMFYEYNCTLLVLDTNGQGLGVYDYIIKTRYDDVTGKRYNALTCINDKDMALRCKEKGATKAVWSVKASASFNTQAVLSLRAAIQNGNINLPASDVEMDDIVKNIRGYSSMTENEKFRIKSVFIQTSLLINETVSLDYKANGVNIQVKEGSGYRKDRFSAFEYCNYVIQNLYVGKNKIKQTKNTGGNKMFSVKSPKRVTRFR